jgi:hypothetical protein
MIYFVVILLLFWVWMISEWINAPHMDDNGKIIKKNDSSTKPNDTNNQEN